MARKQKMTNLETKDSFRSFTETVKEIKVLDPKILAVFLTDSDGMPVYEIGLYDTFSKDGGHSLCSFAAEILSALRGVDVDFIASPFNIVLAENDELNLQLFYLTESIIVGIISSKEADIGLIRMVVQDLLPGIRESLNEMFE
ncbi:MAG: hypothetical protein ACXAEU_25605 [Candidatus Hodarchaeales archaeon]|jgi:hypothetical protein